MAQNKTAARSATKKANVKSASKKKTTARKTGGSGKKAAANKNKSRKNKKSNRSLGRPSSKKGSNKAAYEDDGIMNEVVCLAVLALCIVAIISLFTDKIGLVGEYISGGLKGFFGIGGYFIPIIASVYCLWTLFGEDIRGEKYKIIASVMFIVAISSFSHAISTDGQGTISTSMLYSNGSAGNGGVIGGLIGGALVSLFDKLGTYIILSVFIIISVVMGTGLSFFGGVETAARYVGDSGKKINERNHARAERIKVKKRELIADDEQPKERKRREVFDISLDREEFESGEHGGFILDSQPVTSEDEDVEIYSDNVMPSDYMIRNIARHNGTAQPEINVKNENSMAEINFNKERGIQCVISGNLEEDEEEFDENETPAVMEFNGADKKAAFKLEEVSDEEIKKEGLGIDVHFDEKFEDEEAELTEMVITAGASKEGYRPDKPMEDPNRMNSKIIGGEILTDAEKKAVTGLDDNKLESDTSPVIKTDYKFPSISLLGKDPKSGVAQSKAQMLQTAQKLEDTLKSFGVDAKVVQINQGPTVTRYEVSPSHGVKVSKIVNLADDIALNLAASGIRIEAPIPGKAAVGIEVPNKEQQSVYLRTVLDSEEFRKFPSKLAFGLGQDIAGNVVITDIAKMPHLLIAGATGSGKSVCINTLITSIIYKAKPDEVKLIMVDPKVVELSIYNGIPHLMIPVVTDPKKAAGALNWAVREMLSRYNSFAENSVRDIKGYNAMKADKGEKDFMPQIVIIIDELADLMMASPKEVEDSICRLAQMARAAGIHLIIATQRPSVDVITGVIKANIPSRLAFAVSSGIDSRTILDMNGAEKLLGKGDMLFYPTGMSKPVRIQGAFVTDKEVENIVDFLKEQNKNVSYNEAVMEEISSSVKSGNAGGAERDEFFEDAIDLVVSKDKASVSLLQRQFRIGYNRAARLMDELEDAGIVGPEDGSKPRKVLITAVEAENLKNGN